MPLNDYNTGYKLMKKGVLDGVLGECGTLPENFSTELTARAYKKGYKIKYVPVSFKHLGHGGAQFTPKKLPKVIWNQIRAYIKLRSEL